MALIGGGGGGFIGRVHATAAQLDNRAVVVAGALSSNPDKSKQTAPAFGIADERAYGSYRELLDGETELPAEGRVDFVSIATPNHTHFEIAQAALKAGLHVVCDKPMTNHVAEAEQLAELVAQSGSVFALTHNYTGYPMIRQARAMIEAGELGEIQAVRANYMQGWLCGMELDPNAPRGVWKADPAKAGSGSLGDVGTHAFNLVGYVTGLRATQLSCLMRSFHPERPLDDYGHVAIKFDEAALGMIIFSQITHGRLNDLTLEVDGTKGAISWRQEDPNQLVVQRTGQATQTYDRDPAAGYTNELARDACRIPAGHPEGFFEAFANVYRAAFDDMARHAAGEAIDSRCTAYPNVHDGVEGVRFIAACQASSDVDGQWLPIA
ncbi:MAG: oxidoreductase [Planctomycetaceae bacterium]|nr:oxidoreductase [Planctomycetaceae bacterium]